MTSPPNWKAKERTAGGSLPPSSHPQWDVHSTSWKKSKHRRRNSIPDSTHVVRRGLIRPLPDPSISPTANILSDIHTELCTKVSYKATVLRHFTVCLIFMQNRCSLVELRVVETPAGIFVATPESVCAWLCVWNAGTRLATQLWVVLPSTGGLINGRLHCVWCPWHGSFVM